MKRITIEVDEELFYSFKIYCIKHKTTFKELITELIKEKIEK